MAWMMEQGGLALLCSKADSASGDHVMGALEPERRFVSGRRSLAPSGKNLL